MNLSLWVAGVCILLYAAHSCLLGDSLVILVAARGLRIVKCGDRTFLFFSSALLFVILSQGVVPCFHRISWKHCVVWRYRI
jgi:hypothetical protein